MSLVKFVLPVVLCLCVSCSGPGAKPQPLPQALAKNRPAAALAPAASANVAAALAAPARPLPPAVPPVYRLGAGDEFDLQETRLPSLNRRYVLAPDGGVTIPLLGHYNLAGKTPQEANELLQKDLEKRYREPELSLIMAACRNYRIAVFGEVTNPGEYSFEREADLLALLGRAGGLRKSELLCTATVSRGAGEIYEVDLNALLREGRAGLSLALQPGDRVHVRVASERGCHLMGEVKSPGYYPLEPGMSVLRAINLAGGLTESAAVDRISRIRPQGEGKAELREINLAGLDKGEVADGLVTLQAGDIVYVPITGLGKFNYYLRQVSPGLNMVILGDAVNRTVK